MHSQRLLAIALIAALMLPACSILTMPVSAPPKPLPAAYVAPPPPPPERSGDSPDDVAIDLKRMYDLYGRIAGQLVDLIQWVSDERPD